MAQQLIVGIIIALALIFTGRHMWRTSRRQKAVGCCGCTACPTTSIDPGSKTTDECKMGNGGQQKVSIEGQGH